jgi:hypothetical protein
LAGGGGKNFGSLAALELEESVSGTSSETRLEANWKLEQSTDCRNNNATAKAKSFNENNEGESSPPTDLVDDALRHIEDMKWRRSRISR